MKTTDADLAYMKIAVEELESYLISDVLFWPLGGSAPDGTPFPSLTLGGLLMAKRRLLARHPSPRPGGRLTALETRLETIRDRWRSAWESKAVQEFTSRLRQWEHALQDYRKDPESQAAYYPHDVKSRVMTDLLLREIPEPAREDAELLAGLDRILRSVFLPDEFVWDLDLAPGFPRDPFWYLYGRLRES